jgi:hypothetical protein
MPAGSRASTAASIRADERRDRLPNPKLAAHTPANKKAPPKRQPFFGGVNLIFRINWNGIWKHFFAPRAFKS